MEPGLGAPAAGDMPAPHGQLRHLGPGRFENLTPPPGPRRAPFLREPVKSEAPWVDLLHAHGFHTRRIQHLAEDLGLYPGHEPPLDAAPFSLRRRADTSRFSRDAPPELSSIKEEEEAAEESPPEWAPLMEELRPRLEAGVFGEITLRAHNRQLERAFAATPAWPGPPLCQARLERREPPERPSNEPGHRRPLRPPKIHDYTDFFHFDAPPAPTWFKTCPVSGVLVPVWDERG